MKTSFRFILICVSILYALMCVAAGAMVMEQGSNPGWTVFVSSVFVWLVPTMAAWAAIDLGEWLIGKLFGGKS